MAWKKPGGHDRNTPKPLSYVSAPPTPVYTFSQNVSVSNRKSSHKVVLHHFGPYITFAIRSNNSNNNRWPQLLQAPIYHSEEIIAPGFYFQISRISTLFASLFKFIQNKGLCKLSKELKNSIKI